ncbi:MAG: 23S rRNA (guanosine(2251)-2'-O)-methyltransferase RlmB [Clostridiales Family XIII bacterium]|nr:23S rRNA (guanosine(2251)-2'-O)-methyltransferase RlmB [Clostridiales Family XIII bacterium]
MENNIIYGRNAVIEAIKAGTKIEKILIQQNIEGSGKKVFAMAKDAGIKVQSVDRKVLDRQSDGNVHQGVLAYIEEFEYADLDDLLKAAEESGESPFVVLLDGIEDPHNLGAIIRTAEASGVHGVIIPKNRAASVNATVMKSSAGAAAHLPVVRVTNLVAAMKELKDLGVWMYGLDMAGEPYREQNYSGGVGIVVGSEGKGLSHIVKNECDFLVSIAMRGKVNSLNASIAAAIVISEVSYGRE